MARPPSSRRFTDPPRARRAWETLLRTCVRRSSRRRQIGPRNFAHRRGDDERRSRATGRDKAYSVANPVARRHPRTGRTILFVSQQMTSHIEGSRPKRRDVAQRAVRSCMPRNVVEHD